MVGTVDDVVRAAAEARIRFWSSTGEESTGTKLAKLVTDAWQKTVCSWDSTRFCSEFRIAPHLRARIDLVDLSDGIAYELKVSKNNVHMEVYRDAFKVLAAREFSLPTLRRFVFIAPGASLVKLRVGLFAEAEKIARRIGLDMELRGIGEA
jgi:hypothetical protein